MDLPMRRRRKKIQFEEQYPTRFQLYTLPPDQNITLEEFERLAIKRQKCKQKKREIGLCIIIRILL